MTKNKIDIDCKEIRKNTDCYNSLCSKLGIKSYKTLRKVFYSNPDVLLVYKILTQDLGFKNLDVINEFIKDDFFCLLFDYGNDDLRFYFQKCSEESSEKKF